MDLTTTRLKVSGMTCGHCAETVEKALRNQPGVRNATVHLDAGAAEIEYEKGRTAPEQLIAAVEEAGYAAGMAGKPPGGEF
ncbi:MAG TPA: heavy-metal-associated domain-containing protein [Longimicrobiaceae bacterium]|nr:heavy-metal-associated domain-containing protein [Longimicrobiaceae bacterium]